MTLEDLVANTENIWRPSRERDELDYLDVKEVHISGLIKKTAMDLSKEILGINYVGKSDPEPYYGWRGNGMGEMMSPDFTKREIVVKTSLIEGWTLTGTSDGQKIVDLLRLVTGEWKSHLYPKVGFHDEHAYRQGALYLAILWESYRKGQRVFPAQPGEYERVKEMLAHYEERLGLTPGTLSVHLRPGALDLVCPDGMNPEGVLVRIASAYPEARLAKGWKTGQTDLENVLEFYREKANQVVKAVLAEDPEAAKSWDQMNPTEFTRTFKAIKDPPLEVKRMLIEKNEARKMYTTSDKALKRLNSELTWAYSKGTLEDGRHQISEKVTASVNPPKLGSVMPQIRFLGDDDDSFSGREKV